LQKEGNTLKLFIVWGVMAILLFFMVMGIYTQYEEQKERYLRKKGRIE